VRGYDGAASAGCWASSPRVVQATATITDGGFLLVLGRWTDGQAAGQTGRRADGLLGALQRGMEGRKRARPVTVGDETRPSHG
jgi:hypothetical protein